MVEHELQNEIIATLNHGGVRLFRVNSGIAWQGEIVNSRQGLLVLKNFRKVQLAIAGTPDLYGFRRYRGIAQFGVIEVKAGKRRATKAQKAYIDLVIRLGGFGGTAYSVDDAKRIIECFD